MIKNYSYQKDKDLFLSPHFQVWEFRSYLASEDRLTTDNILIDDELVLILEKVFEKLNCKIIKITSGYRSDDFDRAIGGFLGYHSKGMAADIMCYNEENKLIDSKTVCLALEDLGILGIGYGSNYNHVDSRNSKSYFDETNGAVNIGSWYDYFGITKPVEPQKEETYNIGDKLEINGVYVSSTDNNELIPLVKIGTITKIIAGAKNPYLLENGNIGWVNKDCIIKKLDNNTINVGDKVRVKNAVQYSGEPFITYYDTYDVLEVNGNRIVIGIGSTVTCAININNIEKI